MLVTTTAIYGNELEHIKAGLKDSGVTYATELTASTRVVIAGNTGGAKCRVARERGIPCVTPAWVFLARCSMDRVDEFEIGRTLLGLEVCSTCLTVEERRLVRRVCEAHQATYNAFLTLKCAFLVVPNEFLVLHENGKLQFAKKNHIYVMSYNQFMRQYDYVVEAHCVSAPSTFQKISESASELVVYCSPESYLTETVKSLLETIGAVYVSVLTPLTTHVVMLGPTDEVFFPRPGLEFVSLAWLEECAAQQRHLTAEPYRVTVAQWPVITFTGVPQKERVALCTALEESGLPCFLQAEFVLGKMTGDESDNQRNTTHLVVGRSTAMKSSKVAALGWRIFKLQREECFLVDVEWVRSSIKVGKWLDCVPFALELPHPSVLRKTLMRGTVPTAADMKNGGRDKNEKTQVPRSLLMDVQSDALPPQSLELLIEGLESRTKSYGCMLTTPITTAPQSLCGPKSPLKETTKDHFCVKHNHGAPASSLSSSDVWNCELFSEDSQVIVYRGDGFEKPRKTLRQEGRTCTSSLGVDGIVDAAVCSAMESGVCKTDNIAVEATGRICCIMIAKSLQHMVGNIEGLQALGFRVANTVEECTHYVTGKPSRTEFFLCCVAAGKWVLAPSFLEETLREGRIATEEAHEWRPEIARAAQLRNSVTELVRACRLQRGRAVRPFASWCVVLCCTTDLRTESFSRVLRCGGCCVIRPFSPSELLDTLAGERGVLQDITFVLSDDGLWEASQLDALAAHMSVLRMEYIAHCLCVEKAEPQRYILKVDGGPVRKRLKNDVG